MQVLRNQISVSELKRIAEKSFGNLVKAVVDVERKVMALGGELHADEEALLIEDGSKQRNLWGINLYPDLIGTKEWIEFDSMINIRPSQGNLSRGVDNPDTSQRIIEIVDGLIKR